MKTYKTFKTNTPKRCPFHYRGLEYKSRKSRDTWSNRQIWPWSTKLSRSKANRVLPRERTSHSKHPLPTKQEKTLHMDIIRLSTPKSDWLYSLQQRWRSSIESAKARLGADFGSDHKLLIAKFRLKLKKVGKTTRPFSYDLNQIPYDYTVEVTNRFKWQSAWRTMDGDSWYCTWGSNQDHPQEKERQKVKMIVQGGLTNSLRKEEKPKAKEKKKDIPIWMQSSEE